MESKRITKLDQLRRPKTICRSAKIRGIHVDAFRCGEWAEIVAVKILTPPHEPSRACFMVRYEDDKIDYIPICDLKNYEIRENTGTLSEIV